MLEFFQQLDANFIELTKVSTCYRSQYLCVRQWLLQTQNTKSVADQAKEKAKRDEKWKKLEEMAKSNGMK